MKPTYKHSNVAFCSFDTGRLLNFFWSQSAAAAQPDGGRSSAVRFSIRARL